MTHSAGERFRQALKKEFPLQIIGVINAYVAIMADQVGYRALYLSGAGVANSSYGLPDLGITSLDNVLEDASRILDVTSVPLLVDIDTGWGSSLNIARAIRSLERLGVAAVHIEDQQFNKRCGHRPGIGLVSKSEMCDRIKAALDARKDNNFVIMARTDSLGVEGFDSMLDRLTTYKNVGADMLFLEAFDKLEDYKKVKETVGIPILANITEFGKTPLFTTQQLASAHVDMALYPLSANRAMNASALKVLKEIKEKGTQKNLLPEMQSREQLYQFLNYEKLEKEFGKSTGGVP